MSLESDVQYWENRNWDALSQENQAIAQNFEKCKKVYSQAIKEGILPEDDPKLDFKFTARPWKRSSFTVDEFIRALNHLHQRHYLSSEATPEEFKEALTETLTAMNPTKEAYYLKFR